MPQRDHGSDDDDDDLKLKKRGDYRFSEFDCPGCNANNPSDGFGDRAVVLCNYCGMEWEVRVDDEGRLDLRER
jgi:transcription elongation factor Elf1